MFRHLIFLLLVICFFLINICFGNNGHGNNWAVLVAGSRYWFNYRHIANVLSVYHSIKKLGIPDSQIIVMIADDMACNDRNVFKAQMIASHATTKYDNNLQHSNAHTGNIYEIYDSEIEVDYRGEECNVENVLRLLTNRHDSNVPLSKRLNTNSESNILFYITGHGGDSFLKFHDKEEIQSNDISDAINIMKQQKRFNEILFMIDTCQAATLYNTIDSKNVIGIGSSMKDESSYSFRTDKDLGISIIDRFTYLTLKYFEINHKHLKNEKLINLFNYYDFKSMKSHVQFDASKLKTRPFNDVKITDFFASVNDVDIVKYSIKMNTNNNNNDNNNNSTNSDNSDTSNIPNLWTQYELKQEKESTQMNDNDIFNQLSKQYEQFLSIISINQWNTAFFTCIVILFAFEKMLM